MLGIVIPAYKRKDCLREALQSLCYQTCKQFSVIVVDDHSPEPLKEVVEEFDNKLHIIYKYAEVNGGPGAARQIGLNICYEKDFDLVMFLDSDDMLFPHTVERLTKEINRSMSDVAASKIWNDYGNGGGRELSADNKTFLHGKIFRVSYLKSNNITFPPLRTNEDLSFNLMAIENTQKVQLVQEVLYLFRYEKSSITRSTTEKNLYVHSFDYITANYYAAKFLEVHNHMTYQIAANALATYNYYQLGLNLGLNPSEELKEQIRYLLKLPLTQEVLNEPQKIVQTLQSIKNFTVIGNNIYYYKQTFYDWLKEFTDESSNN